MTENGVGICMMENIRWPGTKVAILCAEPNGDELMLKLMPLIRIGHHGKPRQNTIFAHELNRNVST